MKLDDKNSCLSSGNLSRSSIPLSSIRFYPLLFLKYLYQEFSIFLAYWKKVKSVLKLRFDLKTNIIILSFQVLPIALPLNYLFCCTLNYQNKNILRSNFLSFFNGSLAKYFTPSDSMLFLNR